GALILVVKTAGGVPLARGMTDARGEALVAVQGIPITTFAEHDSGSVLETEIAVFLELIFDPAAPVPPDPDDLENRRGDLTLRTAPATLAAGRMLSLPI